MLNSTSAAPRRALCLLALSCGLAVSAAAQGGPFTAGERWADGAGTLQPWLPDGVLFAAGDELVVTASRGPGGGLALYGAHDSHGSARRGFDGRYALAQGATELAAGERADAVFALAQYPAPDPYSRRVEVARHDALQAARGGSFAPVWLHDMGVLVNGPARVVCDAEGAVVVAAVYDDRSRSVRVDRLDGTSGALLARREFPAPGLARLALSGDGRRVALTAGLGLLVLDEDLDVVAVRALGSTAMALALDFDGATIAVGGLAQLELLREGGSAGYALDSVYHGAPTALATVAAVARDGATFAVAWWDAATGTDVRMDLWRRAGAVLEASWSVAGTPASRQNMPAAVRLSRDGQRAAFGLWGDGFTPEVFLLAAGQALPRMAFDLPGSARALALDETGTRIAVAHKNVHNSVFGSAGAVRLLDTGERALELLAAPTVGGTLRAAVRRPGATGFAFFALGAPLAEGQTFPGIAEGELLLRRGTLTVYPAALDAAGRADLTRPVANDPALAGTRLHVQGAFRVQGGLALTRERLDALVL